METIKHAIPWLNPPQNSHGFEFRWKNFPYLNLDVHTKGKRKFWSLLEKPLLKSVILPILWRLWTVVKKAIIKDIKFTKMSFGTVVKSKTFYYGFYGTVMVYMCLIYDGCMPNHLSKCVWWCYFQQRLSDNRLKKFQIL